MRAADTTFKSAKIPSAYAGGLRAFIPRQSLVNRGRGLSALASDVKSAEKALLEAGFQKKDVLDYSKPKRMIHKFLFGDREVDLLVFPQHEDFLKGVMSRAQDAKGLGKVVSLEDLILLKLFSFRLKDKAHIVEVLESKSQTWTTSKRGVASLVSLIATLSCLKTTERLELPFFPRLTL
jgi:hypothetical protein